MPETVSLGLPLLVAEQAQKHITHNEALRALDAIVQLSVKNRDLAAPPGSPSEDDRYIVAASPTGAWAGHAGDIAVYEGTAWVFHEPGEGWRCWVSDENALLIFNGSDWVDLGSALAELQNLALLGVGTAADATNPFSAKLNKALWTAKYAAEGGDGDLRYTMNKEADADVVSILFQKAFSGRAEFGLIGDNDLLFKVSPDGSSWNEAFRLNKTTGAARFVAGSVSAPGVQVGDADTGLWHTSGTLHLSIDGVEVWTASASALTFTGQQVDVINAAAASRLRVIGDGQGAALRLERYSANSAGPDISCYKGRGTFASPGQVLSGDNIFELNGRAYDDGGTARNTARFAFSATENVTATAGGTRATLWLAPTGSVSLTEFERKDHATGLSMFGTNVVIDQNRHFRLRSYTIGTLPSASPAGQMIYCSDLGGGGGQLNADGTSWRRVSRGGYQTISTDADFTLTPLGSAEEQKHTGTLTADRALTLSTTNAYSGARFRLTRTGGGAFNITHALKNLATNTWAEFIYDGSAWYLAAYGVL